MGRNSGRSEKFIEWLEEYHDGLISYYADAEFIRQMPMDEFEKLSDFVLQNMILQDSGRELINFEEYTLGTILQFKKIFTAHVDMIVSSNYSDSYARLTMKKAFGIESQKCLIWERMIRSNEEKLWKNEMMRKMINIQDLLERK